MEKLSTKEINWLKYEKVRLSGLFNMLTEANKARKMAGLSEKDYLSVIQNYTGLANGLLEKFSPEELAKMVEEV